MTVRRIMGSETEFGVLAQGEPGANPTVLSTRVVTGYAAWVARRLREQEAVRRERSVGSVGPTPSDDDAAQPGSPDTPLGTGWDYLSLIHI